MLENHEVKNIDEQKKIDEKSEETNSGRIRGAARQAGEHHNPCGDVRLTPFEGRRQHRCGQPGEDLWDEQKSRQLPFSESREGQSYFETTTTNVAEEIQQDANAVNGQRFGGEASLIWDSGAGRSLYFCVAVGWSVKF